MEATAESEYNQLITAISSDKGLCGGVNSYIVKQVKFAIAKDEAASVMLVGGKARDGLIREYKKYFTVSMDEVYTKPVTFSLAAFIGEKMLNQEYSYIRLFYNQFQSVVNFEVTALLLPDKDTVVDTQALDAYEFEGDKSVVMGDLYEFFVATSLYNCILENQTSEQASRMTAMDNATNNAGDMIDKLALIYNRTRQAAITNELMEIISGAESL